MERTAAYGLFAERYHWTTQQVDAQPNWYIARLPVYAGIVEDVRAERAKAK